MSNFDWQTEDDYDWDQPEQKTPTTSNSTGQIGIAILIVVLLIGLGWVLNNRLRETVETATTETEADVAASFILLHESAAARDIELFNALLSGLDPDWTLGYQLMVGDNGLLDRSALGWTLAATQPEIEEVILSPSLRSAEITATVAYDIPIGNGLFETVQMAQPAIFREGTTRWLYAPPDEGYWGTRQTQTGTFVSITYPTRDAAWALALQRDLEIAISNRCATECGQTFIGVEFSTSPSALADLRTPPLQVENYRLVLPTPSLVGVPTDQAGYRALLGGYSDLILTSLFTEQSTYRCCDHIAYHRAVSLWALKEAGLRAWPLTLADYESILMAHDSFVEWPLGWDINRPSSVSPENQTIAYAVVEFIHTNYPETSGSYDTSDLTVFKRPVDWMGAMALNSNVEITVNNPDQWQQMQFDLFQQFLIGRITALRQPTTTKVLPDHSFTLACNSENGSQLQQYNLHTQQWLTMATFDQLIGNIKTLPDQHSLWMHFGDPATVNSELQGLSGIWHDGAFEPLSELRLNYTGNHAPNASTLAVRTPDRTAENGGGVLPTYYLLDPQQCTDGRCPLFEQDGLPVWSADGAHFLTLSHLNLLTIKNAANEKVIEQFSLSGFWRDNNNFIWQPNLLETQENNVVDGTNLGQWIVWSELAALLPPANYNIPAMTHFYWRDSAPNQIYLGLLNMQQGSSASIVYLDKDANSADILPYANTRIQQTSPQGRYLLLREVGESVRGVPYNKLHLYDTVTRSHHMTLPANSETIFSWVGDDDQWATLTNGAQIQVIHLLTGDQTFVSIPSESCISADWMLNR